MLNDSHKKAINMWCKPYQFILCCGAFVMAAPVLAEEQATTGERFPGLYADFDSPVPPAAIGHPALSHRLTDNWALDTSVEAFSPFKDMSVAGFRPNVSASGDRVLHVAGFRHRPSSLDGKKLPQEWNRLNVGLSRYFSLNDGPEPLTMDVRLGFGQWTSSYAAEKPDWTISTTLGKQFNAITTSLNAGYTRHARADVLPGHDVWSADLYLGYVVTDAASFGLDYAWSKSPAWVAPARNVSLSASLKLSKLWHLSLRASHNLTPVEQASDLGASLSYRFD